MKLFITNKKDFENQFDNGFDSSNREPLTSSQIHKEIFNKLNNDLTVKNSIPLLITNRYDNGEGVAVFDFITKKDEIYYYQYSGTAS